MDVTCEKCRTEYEFDEALISESGTTVKCTSCGNLFRIFRPGTPESSRLSSWMLKQPDGSVYTFERLATLQRWIAEGKASREDLVSRTGEGWKALGDIAELAPFFEAADAAFEDDQDWPDDGPTIEHRAGASGLNEVAQKSTMTGYGPPKAPPPSPARSRSTDAFASAPTEPGTEAARAVPVAAPAVAAAARTGPAEPDLSDLPADRSSGAWVEGALLADDKGPAWAERPEARPTGVARKDEPAWAEGRAARAGPSRASEDEEDGRPRRARRAGPIVAVALGLAAVLGAGVIWLVRPDLLETLASQLVSSESGDTSSQAYLRGREYFLLDTNTDFEQADREFHRGPDGDGLTRAGLAEVYTVWAQYYLDEVADGRLRAKNAAPAAAAAQNARAELRNEDFQQKLEQARRFVDAALRNAPDAAASHRAAADYYRLAGQQERASSHVEKAVAAARRDPAALPEVEYVAALVDLSGGAEPSEVVGRLRSVAASNDKLIRVHYRLARLLAARGERTGALASLARVLELNPDHDRAQELRAALRSAEPLVVAVASATLAKAAPAVPDAGPADAAQPDAAVALALAPDAAPSGTDAPAPGAASLPQVVESPEALIARASKLQSSGNSQACNLFKQADRLRPGHPEVQTGLGYCAMEEGRTGAAMGHFRRALSASGAYGPALIGMAESSRAQGNKRQALDYYRRYLSAHPGGGEATIARAAVERLERELAEAEGGAAEPAPLPAPGGEAPGGAGPGPGPAEPPTVTRITEDHTPAAPRSDSLAVDSEPPLRPGEDLD